MILQAKKQNETKVSKEIHKIKAKMEAMQDKIEMISGRVARLEPGPGDMSKAELTNSIGKLEKVWGDEVGTLKHELWQTIQAHNHNADLLKHHKDAIDQVQARIDSTANVPNPEVEKVHALLRQMNKVTRDENEKDKQLEDLSQRLSSMYQQLQSGVGHWGAALGQPSLVSQAEQSARLKQNNNRHPKVAKAKPKATTVSMNSLANFAMQLRPEAPEFVPTFQGAS